MPRFRPTRFVVLLALALSLVVVQPLVSSVEAATPTPATRTFTAPLDSPGDYQAQTICDPIPRPGVVTVKNLLLKTYGDRVIYIPRYGCTGTSEHNEGRALDWMISARVASQKATAQSFISWLQKKDQWGHANAMAARMGVMYIIWNNKMWRAYDPGRGWTEYKSCSTRTSTGNDTECHRNHVHISFTWDGAMAKTSFYTGKALDAGRACGPISGSGAASPSAAGQQFVPVRATRLVDTATGKGVSGGQRCRIEQDGYAGESRRFDVQVAGAQGVPATGASAVVLAVRTATNAASSVLVWPTGASKPSTVQVSAGFGADGRATVVVPLGSGGRISMATTVGSQWVTADVLGYYTAGSGMLFNPTAPKRVLSSVTLGPGKSRTVTLGGASGLPASGIGGVSLSVNTSSATSGGNLRVMAQGAEAPGADPVVYRPGVPRAASMITRTTTNGTLTLTNMSATATVAVALDLNGWFGTKGMAYTATRGARILDTRTGTGASGAVTGGRTITFTARGVAGVPTSAKAVALQLTALKPAGAASAVVWPAGTSIPTGHQFATEVKGTSTQYVVAPIGSNGKVSLRGTGASTDYQAAVVGWWVPTSAVGTITGGGSASAPPVTKPAAKGTFAVKTRLASTSLALSSRTTISGSVSPGSLAKGQQVVIQRRTSNGWATAAKVNVASSGAYSYTITPKTVGITTYRVWKSSAVCTSGKCNWKGAGSSWVTLTVKQKYSVGFTVADATVTKGTVVRFSGTLAPAPKGSKVSVQRVVNGVWKTVGTPVVSANGRFTYTTRHTGVGSYKYRVWKPSTLCTKGVCLQTTGVSRVLSVSVR